MEALIMQLFNGISLSSILLLTALGLAITFGLMNVINMAHGEFIMVGAYTTYVVQNIFLLLPNHFFNLYYVFALPAAFITAAAIGWAIEVVMIRHLYGRPLDSLLVTWGVSLVLQQLARTVFGTPNVDVRSPSWLLGTVKITNTIQLPVNRLFIIGLVIAICTITYVVLYKSRNGRRIRAVMQNRNMAMCLGIPVRTVDSFTFAAGSGLAGVAGSTIALIGSIGSSLGQNYIVDTFMTVVLGGVGKIAGTVAGSVLIGVGNPTAEFFTGASAGKVIVLFLVIIFLQFRPKGLVTISSRSLEE